MHFFNILSNLSTILIKKMIHFINFKWKVTKKKIKIFFMKYETLTGKFILTYIKKRKQKIYQ